MEYTLMSVRVNAKHITLENKIREIDTNPDMTRTAIIIRAIKQAEMVTTWKPVSYQLSKLKLDKILEGNISTMQAKLNVELNSITKQIKDKITLDLDLQVLQQQYFLQLILQNYLNELIKTIGQVGDKKENNYQISGPEMFEVLARIVIANRKEDKNVIEEIKRILIEWRNSNESVSI